MLLDYKWCVCFFLYLYIKTSPISRIDIAILKGQDLMGALLNLSHIVIKLKKV